MPVVVDLSRQEAEPFEGQTIPGTPGKPAAFDLEAGLYRFSVSRGAAHISDGATGGANVDPFAVVLEPGQELVFPVTKGVRVSAASAAAGFIHAIPVTGVV